MLTSYFLFNFHFQDDDGHRKRGKYKGPKPDNYDRLCEYNSLLRILTFGKILRHV